ncbi:MAG TPA: hypothetical protein VFE33_11130 [Thermoanaerobaculia bacterium]|nr:hypothetical protein [Thermoanaerobaculia bacterium]
MKNLRLIALLILTVLLGPLVTSCRQGGPNDNQLAKKVQELEARAGSLEVKLKDHELKTRVVFSVYMERNPWNNPSFLGTPFWGEKTYNSARADCANRCIEAAAKFLDACKQKDDPTQAKACYEQETVDAGKCQMGCAGY